MNVIGFCGFSGSGKTTLVEQLIGRLRAAGRRVSVVKHAHHEFDIDHPGKDSWRHRRAGAYEVVIASDRRLAKMREFAVRSDPTVHDLIAELAPCDWVLVEGFKRAALPKIEVWRAETGKPIQYPDDPHVVAVATDRADRLAMPTDLPLLDLNDAGAVATFLLADPARFVYRAPADRRSVAASAAPGAAQVEAVAWLDGVAAPATDAVAEEVPVTLRAGGTVLAELFATPVDLDDLALGFLLGAGIVDTAADLLAVEVGAGAAGIDVGLDLAPRCAGRRARQGPAAERSGVRAAPGLGGRVRPARPDPGGAPAATIDPAALARGMKALALGGDLRRATGATHAAAWLSPAGEVLAMREDVGRHNALDKLIGAMARSGRAPGTGFVAVTSRASHEIVAKVAACGVGLLAVMSAPTVLAIRSAEQAGLTLVGFARGGNATVYTHAGRVAPAAQPRDEAGAEVG